MATAMEFHWKRHRTTYIQPGVSPPLIIAIPIPAASETEIVAKKQSIFVAGSISYNDGFEDDNMQGSPFCWQTIYHLTIKQIFWTQCDPTFVIPRMETWDGYPKNEQHD